MNKYLRIIAALIFFVFINNINAQYIQQGGKLVATGIGNTYQGCSVSVSSDGNTAIIGGLWDNSYQGAAWIFTRVNGIWSQGPKLVGTGAVGNAEQGYSVAISGDGNTAIIGAVGDSSARGASWIFVKENGVWKQQGNKLVGSGSTPIDQQGRSVSISSDGNTAIVGGPGNNTYQGAVWIFVRTNGIWTQQGPKLAGTGAAGTASQGVSVAISKDGNTAITGGWDDNNTMGAAWVFTRQNGVWTQQGSKLVGTGAVGVSVYQGASVSLSSDGNTALIGGSRDNYSLGAVWVFVRQNGIWSQQGNKLSGTGAVGGSVQGISVSLSQDGNIAAVGGYYDNSYLGATWIYKRVGGVWSQYGNKLVGTGSVGSYIHQGRSVSLSSDGSTLLVGGFGDNNNMGATWVFVSPTYTITANAGEGGTITPSGSITVNSGSSKTFTITPNTGYHTSGVTVDGAPANDSVKSYTFSNVNENHTIQVAFAPDAVAGVPIPVISYPTGGITVYTTAPIVSWYITGYYAGARYHLQVSESPNFNTITYQKDDINGIQSEVPGLIGGKTYYLRVRLKTVDNLYGYYSTVESFKVNEAGTIPVTPIISYPTNGTIVYVSNPTVTWYIPQQAPAQKYQLQMSLSNDFTNPLLNVPSIDGLTYQLSGLTGGTTYYLRIRSFTSTGSYSAYSSVVSFKVNAGIGTQAVTPVISYPTGGITIYTTSTFINWYITSYQPTQKYNLQLSTRQDFATLVINQDNIPAIQYQATGLTPGMTYYIRVRGKASDGSYSLFSSIQWFTVSAGSYSVAIPVAGNPSFVTSKSGVIQKDNHTPKDYGLSQNYPNPFNPSTTIEFSVPKNEIVSFTIYDMLGRVIRVILNEELSAGIYKVSFSGEEFSSGVYIYRLSTPSVSITKKMIMQK